MKKVKGVLRLTKKEMLGAEQMFNSVLKGHLQGIVSGHDVAVRRGKEFLRSVGMRIPMKAVPIILECLGKGGYNDRKTA